MPTNGEVRTKDLTDTEKLDLILEGLAELNTLFESFQEEINERLNNLSLGGADYAIDLLPIDES